MFSLSLPIDGDAHVVETGRGQRFALHYRSRDIESSRAGRPPLILLLAGSQSHAIRSTWRQHEIQWYGFYLLLLIFFFRVRANFACVFFVFGFIYFNFCVCFCFLHVGVFFLCAECARAISECLISGLIMIFKKKKETETKQKSLN